MRMTMPVLAAVGVAAVPASPAPASAAKPKAKSQRAQFEVRILGEQRTNWGTLSDDQGETCRTKVSGSGTEQVIFHTGRPHKLSVYATRNLNSYVFGNLLVDGVATVNREGYEHVTVEDPCPPVAEGDPSDAGAPPPGPDCGEKETRIGLELSFTRKTVELTSDGSGDELFDNCPVYGTSYPQLLTLDGVEGGGARPLRANLRLADLMNRKRRRFEVSAHGDLVDNYAEASTNTTIDWTIRLERLPKRR